VAALGEYIGQRFVCSCKLAIKNITRDKSSLNVDAFSVPTLGICAPPWHLPTLSIYLSTLSYPRQAEAEAEAV